MILNVCPFAPLPPLYKIRGWGREIFLFGPPPSDGPILVGLQNLNLQIFKQRNQKLFFPLIFSINFKIREGGFVLAILFEKNFQIFSLNVS